MSALGWVNSGHCIADNGATQIHRASQWCRGGGVPGRSRPTMRGTGMRRTDRVPVCLPYLTQRPSTNFIPVAQRAALRRAAVRTQTPFTRCMPAPHASRTVETRLSA